MTRKRIAPPKAAPRLWLKPHDIVRFVSQIEYVEETGCWLWTGYRDANGYGQFSIAGRAYWAHRIAYLHWKGPLRDGDQVDHRCCEPSCVNPEHLVRVPIGKHMSESAKKRWAKSRQQSDEPPF